MSFERRWSRVSLLLTIAIGMVVVPILSALIAMAALGFFSPWATEEEVFATLSYTVWKSMKEIAEEIDRARGLGGILRSVAPESVSSHLHTLEEEGVSEHRVREWTTSHTLGRQVPTLEFRLTEHGLRRRVNQGRKINTPLVVRLPEAAAAFVSVLSSSPAVSH